MKSCDFFCSQCVYSTTELFAIEHMYLSCGICHNKSLTSSNIARKDMTIVIFNPDLGIQAFAYP